MNNILLINLKRSGDIFSSANLVSSLAQDRNNKISILVFKEFEKAAKCLTNIDNVFTIDRKKVISFKNNAIYSDGFALDTLYTDLEVATKTSWNKVINYSNDKVSSYLASYFTSINNCKFEGVKFNKSGIIQHSNQWAIYFNDIVTTFIHTPFSFNDIYHKTAKVFPIENVEKIKTISKHNKEALSNFNKIRKSYFTNSENTKLIGIQLKTSSMEKDIDCDVTCEVIKYLLETEQYVPILLVAPNSIEKTYANKINSKFENKLVAVESDFYALPSVLQNLDLLVTPDTSVKHVADLVSTPMIEISQGKSPFLKQGSIQEGNIILTSKIPTRTWGQTLKLQDNLSSTVDAKDITTSIEHFFNNNYDLNLSEGITSYIVAKDGLGSRYDFYSGSMSVNFELSRIISREYIKRLFNEEGDYDLYPEVFKFSHKGCKSWVECEKDNLTRITRDLLNTLRSLCLVKNSDKHGKAFMDSLDKLLAHSDDQSLASIAVLFFRGNLEALDAHSTNENLNSIENLLYNLKSQIQIALGVIKDIDQKLTDNRKIPISGRNTEAVMS
jgi:ADP-heptose:LPS heptosyltransferase